MIKVFYCTVYNLQREIDNWIDETEDAGGSINIINIKQLIDDKNRVNNIPYVLCTILYEAEDNVFDAVN